MSATVSIITTPDSLSPILNSPTWFRLNSISSTFSNFKYVVKLKKEEEPFTGSYDTLQTYKLPPRPTGEAQYSPSKMLESFFTFQPDPYIQNWEKSDNALLRYMIDYGFEYNPNLTFVSTLNVSGDLVLGFTYSTGLQTGDIIRIDKTNKTVNSQYDGLATVGLVAGGLVRTNVPYGTASSNEGGKITSLLRITGTSSSYDAFYGTRQYNERTFNFGGFYKIGNVMNNKFLSEYNPQNKPVYITDYETISMILSGTQGYSAIIKTYDTTGNQLGTFSYPITNPNNYYRQEFGVGPANIIDNTGNSLFFSGVDRYTILVQNDYSINLNYNNGSQSYNVLLYNQSGFYNSKPYWTWSDLQYNYSIWYSNSNTLWEVSSVLGGGNSYLQTNTSTASIPPTGTGSVWLTGQDPLFTSFSLESGYFKSITRGYKFTDNCYSDENIRLVFLNRLSGWEYFNFSLGGRKTINVERETYKKVLPWNYNEGDRGDTTFSQKAEEVWTIRSNWITQKESEWLSELIESRDVYVVRDNSIFPIQILSKSYEVKSQLRDQVFNLEIQFKYAYNKII